MSTKLFTKALRILRRTGSPTVAHSKTGVNLNTLKTWKLRHVKACEVKPKVQPEVKPLEAPVGQWMQSLHHESAHFLTEGKTACSHGDNGAKIDAGGKWMPWNQCLRKCTRCMGALAKGH